MASIFKGITARPFYAWIASLNTIE